MESNRNESKQGLIPLKFIQFGNEQLVSSVRENTTEKNGDK